MPSDLFSDLLVIDCASFIAGPAAATIMSDFGARVIKIEPPGVGDSYRALIKLRGDDIVDYFWTLDSRNKESLAIDLKTAAGRAVLDALIPRADVFITNYPFPIRERLGLRAQDVMPLNKRLIYASMSPYGEHGPERDRTAFDTAAWWARSGLMDMVRATGDTEPALSVPGMGDHPTAVAMYAAILTALYRRQMTGEGGEVSTSLLANGLWSNGCQVQAALCDLDDRLVGANEPESAHQRRREDDPDGTHGITQRAHDMLVCIEQTGLFLIPLDTERGWYRYHMLFAEAIRHRLNQDAPELAALLRQRAAAWYAERPDTGLRQRRSIHCWKHTGINVPRPISCSANASWRCCACWPMGAPTRISR